MTPSLPSPFLRSAPADEPAVALHRPPDPPSAAAGCSYSDFDAACAQLLEVADVDVPHRSYASTAARAFDDDTLTAPDSLDDECLRAVAAVLAEPVPLFLRAPSREYLSIIGRSR